MFNICVCVYTHSCTHIYTHTHIYTPIYTHTYIYTDIHTHTYIYTHSCTHIYTHTHIYTYIHIPTHICICIYAVYAQMCLTLCNSMDSSPPGSSVRGIFQTRILEGVALSPPGDLPNPWIELGVLHLLRLLHWQADSLPLAPPGMSHAKFGDILMLEESKSLFI